MTSVDYKILFEVRVLHDYYLFGVDPAVESGGEVPAPAPQSYFTMPPASRDERLQALLRSGRYDIGKDLDFVPDAGTRRMCADLRLRLVKTATGFFVGMEVTPADPGPNGERCFAPKIKPSADATLRFAMAAVNPSFGGFSNLRTDRDLYRFTNLGEHDLPGSGERPWLSSPPEPVVSGERYHMGDLAVVNGELRQATVDNDGDAGAWVPVSAEGCIHRGDLSLARNDDFDLWRRTALPELPGVLLGVLEIALTAEEAVLSPLTPEGILLTRILPGQSRATHPVFELRILSRSTYWLYWRRGGFKKEEQDAIIAEAREFLEASGTGFVTRAPRQLAREHAVPAFGNRDKLRLPNAQAGSIRARDRRLYSEVQLHDAIIPE